MAPKFIVDINLPGLSAEEQQAACQAQLEAMLEEISATPVSIEMVEGSDGVDTRPKPKEEKKEEPATPRPTVAPGPAAGPVPMLRALISRDARGKENICVLQGKPVVFSDPAVFEKAKLGFKNMMTAEPPPAGMTFWVVDFLRGQAVKL